MLNGKNSFRKGMADYEQQRGPLIATKEQDLTPEQKKTLLLQTKMYIQIEEIMTDFKKQLAPDEEIVGFLPMTNEGNSSIGTSGLMGARYVQTEAGKKYRDSFLDLRGNRTLIFTNQHVHFMVFLDYLEEGLFFTYDFDKINGIRLERHKLGFFDWDNGKFLPTRKYKYWYTLDFQAGQSIFIEMLPPQDADKFIAMVRKIPQLAALTMDNHVHRQTKFDYLVNNTKLATKVFYLFWFIFIAWLILTLIYQLIVGRGHWYELFHPLAQPYKTFKTLGIMILNI